MWRTPAYPASAIWYALFGGSWPHPRNQVGELLWAGFIAVILLRQGEKTTFTTYCRSSRRACGVHRIFRRFHQGEFVKVIFSLCLRTRIRCGWLALVVFAGCIETQYSVELTPDGDSLDRKLTVDRRTTTDSDVPDDELTRLGKEYNVPAPAVAKKHRFEFRGRFAGRMPDDVGGHGAYTRWETSLGGAALYVERFRGSDDVAGELKRRQAAADRLVDLLVGWLESEMDAEPQWPALRRFLNEDVRRDLSNLGVYAWTLELSPRSEEVPQPFLRAAQYFAERGYFTWEELPEIKRAMDGPDSEREQWLLNRVRRIIVARVWNDAPPPRLGFLISSERLAASARRYLETTAEYAALLQERQTNPDADPQAVKPDPLEALTELMKRLVIAGELHSGGDRVTVTLKADAPPILTNGTWSPEARHIQWEPQTIVAGKRMPGFAYAAWDEPDQEAQRKVFGVVVLRDESLFEYCLWYRGLSDREQREWDALLGRLGPGPDLIQDLQDFRFTGEPADRGDSPLLAAPIVDAIVEELAGSR